MQQGDHFRVTQEIRVWQDGADLGHFQPEERISLTLLPRPAFEKTLAEKRLFRAEEGVKLLAEAGESHLFR
jgi:hypothetical protein